MRGGSLLIFHNQSVSLERGDPARYWSDWVQSNRARWLHLAVITFSQFRPNSQLSSLLTD